MICRPLTLVFYSCHASSFFLHDSRHQTLTKWRGFVRLVLLITHMTERDRTKPLQMAKIWYTGVGKASLLTTDKQNHLSLRTHTRVLPDQRLCPWQRSTTASHRCCAPCRRDCCLGRRTASLRWLSRRARRIAIFSSPRWRPTRPAAFPARAPLRPAQRHRRHRRRSG